MENHELDDTECLKRISSGNREAFNTLFLKYFPKVKSFLTHVTGSEIIGEELAQDIFIAIWVKRKNMVVVRSFNAYLYRMSKNAALNYIKHEQIELKSAQDYQHPSEPSIEETLYANEIEEIILKTVSKMPTQRKRIFEMSRIDGLKNDEIAMHLGLTKKTVENHLNMALKELKKAICMLLLLIYF